MNFYAFNNDKWTKNTFQYESVTVYGHRNKKNSNRIQKYGIKQCFALDWRVKVHQIAVFDERDERKKKILISFVFKWGNCF